MIVSVLGLGFKGFFKKVRESQIVTSDLFKGVLWLKWGFVIFIQVGF